MHTKKSKNCDTIVPGDPESDESLLADIWGFATAAKAKADKGACLDDDDDEVDGQSRPSSSASSTMKQQNPLKKKKSTNQLENSSPPVKKQKLGPQWETQVSKLQIDFDSIKKELAASPSAEVGSLFSGIASLLVL